MASDELVFSLLGRHIRSDFSGNLLCLDGLPRRLSQATKLDSFLAFAPTVFCLNVPEAELRSRIAARWIHPSSGRTYHSTYYPPQKAGFDDLSGEPLIRRHDDNETTFPIRLSEYSSNLSLLQDYYKSRMTVVEGRDSAMLYAKISEYLSPGKEACA